MPLQYEKAFEVTPAMSNNDLLATVTQMSRPKRRPRRSNVIVVTTLITVMIVMLCGAAYATDVFGLYPILIKQVAPSEVLESTGNAGFQQTGDGLALFANEIDPLSAYSLIGLEVNANSTVNIASSTGDTFNLVKDVMVTYDLTWFPRNEVKVGLWDVNTGEIQSIKVIRNGSATGSITVPTDGRYYFFIENTGNSLITINGAIEP